MPRWFIHINTNPDHQYVRIHPARNNPCGHILRNIIPSGRISSEKLDGKTFRIGKTDNGHWLILWENPLKKQRIMNRFNWPLEQD